MNNQPTQPSSSRRIIPGLAWWWTPLIIVAGQLLMSFTGYRAWAAGMDQELMLSLLVYLVLSCLVLSAHNYLALRRLLRDGPGTEGG